MKKILIFSLMIPLTLFAGCAEIDTSSSTIDQSLVGTWESGIVNSYYIHQMIFGQDGSYTGRWLYASNRGEYNEISGTWTADGNTLTLITNHTDMYSYSFTNDDSVRLNGEGINRLYFRSSD
jgi:hypothetical protein